MVGASMEGRKVVMIDDVLTSGVRASFTVGGGGSACRLALVELVQLDQAQQRAEAGPADSILDGYD